MRNPVSHVSRPLLLGENQLASAFVASVAEGTADQAPAGNAYAPVFWYPR